MLLFDLTFKQHTRNAEFNQQKYNRIMFRYIAAAAIFGCVAISGQTSQKSVSRQKQSIDRIAEDRIAQAIDAMRQQEGLAKLKRRRASREEVQLVCTAAVTGSSVHEPKFGALQVYSTDDLSQHPEGLKVIAFGTSYDSHSGTRYRVYSDKDWESYAVVVYSSPSRPTGAPTFTVGVARHSRTNDLFGWMTFDHPISDSTDWKKQVAPECVDQRP